MKCQLCEGAYFLFNVPPKLTAGMGPATYILCRDCITLVAMTHAIIKISEEGGHGIR